LQIVLCGQPELRERLSRPELRQLRQRITVRYQISTLAEEDAARYIDHRLTVASGEAGHRVVFDAPAAVAIHRYAEGRPRVINAVADHALLAGYVAGQTVINEACVQKAIEQLEGPA
jgi:general secretion pathway protein A